MAMKNTTEQTPNGLATYTNDSGDFRIYEPKLMTGHDDKTVQMTLCEELVDGRWEAFYSISSK
jgi:hypothetical protein